METVTIPRQEYERSMQASQVDEALVRKIRKSLEDIKEGRIREWTD